MDTQVSLVGQAPAQSLAQRIRGKAETVPVFDHLCNVGGHLIDYFVYGRAFEIGWRFG
jgi:hypothetical protein